MLTSRTIAICPTLSNLKDLKIRAKSNQLRRKEYIDNDRWLKLMNYKTQNVLENSWRMLGNGKNFQTGLADLYKDKHETVGNMN